MLVNDIVICMDKQYRGVFDIGFVEDDFLVMAFMVCCAFPIPSSAWPTWSKTSEEILASPQQTRRRLNLANCFALNRYSPEVVDERGRWVFN